MTRQYKVYVEQLSPSEKDALFNEIDRLAFLTVENVQQKYFDVTWEDRQDIRQVIKFPKNCTII